LIRPSFFHIRLLTFLIAVFAMIFVFPADLMAQEEAEPPTNAVEATPLEWKTVGDFLSFEFGDNTFGQYLLSFCLLLATFVVRKIFLLIFAKRLRAWTEKSKFTYDVNVVRAFEGPFAALIFLIGIFAAIRVLTLDAPLQAFIINAFEVGLLAILFWAGLRLIDVVGVILTDIAEKRRLGIYHFIPLIRKTARVFFVIIGSILIIQNLGYSVGSLLAGLGIGGLAIALAAQESLGNFFGSISIAADRTFKVGDWIVVGDRVDGTVEEIGLRSTKVRTWSRTLLTIPNKLIANEVVENWSKMPNRRVRQVVGVSYSTTRENMDGLVKDIEQLLRNNPEVDQKFIMVRFTDFGESSLDILVYYFTRPIGWAEHLRVRQEMNLAIMGLVEQRQTSIAFPTRTLHLHRHEPEF
jgi:MscS family membrane protein